MRSKPLIVFTAALLLGVFHCRPAGTERQPDRPLNVLLLYSGDFFNPASLAQDRAMREAFLAGTNRPVNFYLETLHAYNLSASDFEGEFVSFLRRKYQQQDIDLILAGGAAALNFLDRNRTHLWLESPAMFFSVDESVVRDRKFSPGLTGLSIRFDPEATLDFAIRIQPRTRRVVVISGTSEADRYWLPAINSHLQTAYPTLPATFLTNQTVPELAAELTKLPAEAVVLYTTVLTDASGKRFVPRDVIAGLSKVSQAPIYGLYQTMLDHGIVGGVIPSLEYHGQLAAARALRVIAGEKPEDIPASPSSPNVPMVDGRQLRRWSISEDRLPPGSIILFKPTTLWGQHRNLIIGVTGLLILETATITALLVQHAQRRRAETTARSLGGRLINAQEDERRRIARELHDDLNQRLALLSVEMELLGRHASEHLPSAKLEQLTGQVRELSSDVHKLAYQLHPAKLDQLGLVAAANSFCRELSEQSGVKIDFVHNTIPRHLYSDTALCVFRIIQESLHNVVRHSGAKEAHVELSARTGGIRLVVSDNGKGFAVEELRRTGLGLLSMQERARLVDGTLEIHSTPGNGTQVELTVPLQSEETVA